MHIKERLYTADDREALLALTLNCFDGVSIDQNIERKCGVINSHDWQWRKARDLLHELDDTPAGVYVLEDGDGAIAGFITTLADADTRIGRIFHLAVRPDVQGMGLGRRLILSAIDHLRKQGMSHVRIETLEQNKACAHLYPSMGFEETARQIHFVMEIPAEQAANAGQ